VAVVGHDLRILNARVAGFGVALTACDHRRSRFVPGTGLCFLTHLRLTERRFVVVRRLPGPRCHAVRTVVVGGC
jgi:hypothetical protein